MKLCLNDGNNNNAVKSFTINGIPAIRLIKLAHGGILEIHCKKFDKHYMLSEDEFVQLDDFMMYIIDQDGPNTEDNFVFKSSSCGLINITNSPKSFSMSVNNEMMIALIHSSKVSS